MPEYATVSYASEDVPARNSPIAAASDEIAKEVAMLGEVASVLVKRLQPLLPPADPAPTSGETLSAIRKECSPHVARLHSHVDEIAEVRERLAGLLERLDV